MNNLPTGREGASWDIALNKNLLRKHISSYLIRLQNDPAKASNEVNERAERSQFYTSWTSTRLNEMKVEDLIEFITRLWAMSIWANKQYVVKKLVQKSELRKIGIELGLLLWGSNILSDRWDRFRHEVKGFGPAAMSELLCYTHPNECALWNRRIFVGLTYLGAHTLPRYSQKISGQTYLQLCELVVIIMNEFKKMGCSDIDMLTVNYFIWDELQVENNLSEI